MSKLQYLSVDNLAGSSVPFAYAAKAGPWIFLNGHEANYEADIKPVQSVTNGILLFSYRRNSLQVTIPELL